MISKSVEEPAGRGRQSLGVAAAKGFAVSAVQATLSRLLSLLGFVVLARLLTPRDYGIVALANVFVILLNTFAAAGYGQAIVQKPKIEQIDLDTVFWLGLGFSAGLTALMFFAAWPLSWAFHTPQLRSVLQVLSPSFIFIATGSVHQAVLQRRFAFRRLAVRTLASDFISTAVGIGFALAGLGVWSLVIQSLLGVILMSVGCMVQSGYRPSFAVSLARFWPLFRTSRMFLGTMLTTFFDQRTDDFLIGSTIGVSALGIYTVAYRVLQIMLQVLSLSASRVVFPIFSHIQDDTDRVRRAYLSVVRASTAAVFPVFLFLIAAAPEITTTLFGHKWAASIPVMRILAVYGPISLVQLLSAALLQAVGRARFVFRVSVCSTVLQIAAFGVAVNFGIEWVAASFVIRAYLVVPFLARAACHELDVKPLRFVATVAPATISSIAMVAAVLIVAAGIPLPLIPQLAMLVVIATLAYVQSLDLLARETLAETVGYMRAVVRRQMGSAGAAAPVK